MMVFSGQIGSRGHSRFHATTKVPMLEQKRRVVGVEEFEDIAQSLQSGDGPN